MCVVQVMEVLICGFTTCFTDKVFDAVIIERVIVMCRQGRGGDKWLACKSMCEEDEEVCKAFKAGRPWLCMPSIMWALASGKKEMISANLTPIGLA